MYAGLQQQQPPFINKKRLLARHYYGDIIRVENDMNEFYDANRHRSGSSKRFSEFTFESTRQFGPTKQRRCTDCGCLFIFILFLGVWASLIVYFLNHVNIEQVVFPSDSFGNVCGKGEFSDRPYLYFFNILKCAADIEGTIIDGCNTPQVCVKECPNITFSVGASNEMRHIELEHAICQYGIWPNRNNLYQLTQKELCAKYYFKSDSVGGRCIPSILHLINDRLFDEIRNQSIKDDSSDGSVTAEEIVESNKAISKLMQALTLANHLITDIIRTWKWIAIGLILTMFIAFLWISFMQWIARYMVWVSIIALFILNSLVLYYSVDQYLDLVTNKSNKTDLADMNSIMAKVVHPNEAHRYLRTSRREPDMMDFDFKSLLKDSLEPYLGSTKLWIILAVVAGIGLLVLTMITFCLCNRIRLAVAVIEEASKAVNNTKSTLMFPLVPFTLKVAILTFALFAFVTISTGSQARYRNQLTGTACSPLTEIDNNCTKIRPFDRSLVYLAHGFNLFALIWVLYFISGLFYVTLSGVFADYYWTRDKRDISFFVLLNSFGRCIFYHLGSIAFGSLLIAIVRFIRIILEYIDQKCKKYPNNVISRFFMGCCKCCLWCLEKFIKFINKNAYIMLAVHGKSFCSSAHDAFQLIFSNGMRALVLECLSAFLLFLSKLAVTFISGLIAFLIITNQIEFVHLGDFDDLNYYWGPLGVYLILSYILASSFFNVYDVAVDTIFLSYLEDCHINDGSNERPYYMTKSLAKVFGRKNNQAH
ncbi:choline transporter-like 2 isoform X1 [Dermatophagoides farinae]|uniref:choline transporter-like 2 isoform X1 n=1 Tax=Dermatophagoides farinae TaxID=6954 RepID=UPI003F5F97E1